MTKTQRGILTAILLFTAVSRLYDPANYPAAFGQDEIVVGYDAYCLLHTARDHHGEFLPLMPRMFNDYLSGVQTYWTIPFIALLGPTEHAVRFACSIPNVVFVLLMFLVTRRLFKSIEAALLTSFVVAIAPWHIFFSRWAVQPNFVPFFLLLFIVVFHKAMDSQSVARGYAWSILAGFAFVLLAQIYPAQMFFAPFLALVLGLMYLQRKFFQLLVMGSAVMLGMLPFVIARLHRPAAIARFYKETILFEHDFLSLFWMRYTEYLSPAFLFEPLRTNYWQQFPGTAYFPMFLSPFLAFGLFILIVLLLLPAIVPYPLGKRIPPAVIRKIQAIDLISLRRGALFVFCWLLLAPVPAALFVQMEYSTRAIQLFPVICLVMALGLTASMWVIRLIPLRSIRWGIILVFIAITGFHLKAVVQSMRNDNDYFKDTMQFGLQEAIEYLDKQPGLKEAYFEPLNQAYIYYLFYAHIDPRTLDTTELSPPPPVRWEDWHYLSIPRVRNYYFNATIDPEWIKANTVLRQQIRDLHRIRFNLYEDNQHRWYVVGV